MVESLQAAVGERGTVVVPTFTRQVADPDPLCSGIPDPDVRARRDAVACFQPDMMSSMGAIPEALRNLPASMRSPHPQASVTAVGAQAASIVAEQPFAFALGRSSPFGRIYDLGCSAG